VSRRSWLIAGGVVLAIAGVIALYDVLVETDEERLEAQFIPDVSGSITRTKIDRACERWVDLERQTLEVSALGQAQAYRAGESEALRDDAHERLRSLEGTSARVISSGIVIEGDTATVTLRLMNDQLGMQTAEWTLDRHDGDWLVSRLSVRR
jgi:hypothetical protein